MDKQHKFQVLIGPEPAATTSGRIYTYTSIESQWLANLYVIPADLG